MSARNIPTPSPPSTRRWPSARRRRAARHAMSADSGFAFDIEIRVGAGSYVCGEETALLESLEGRRGVVRARPPLPAHKGAFGRPTVGQQRPVASPPCRSSSQEGAKAYAEFGAGRSRGTMPIQLAGMAKYGGLFETGFGLTLGELVDDIGGGTLERPAGPRRAGRRPARRLFPARAVRHALRLRGFHRPRRADRPRRHRRLRRYASTWRGRRGSPWNSAPSNPAASARPAGSARPAASRPSTASGPASTRGENISDPRRPLPHDEIWIALCTWRVYALSCHECAQTFPGRFRARRPSRWPRSRRNAMSLVTEIDYGTPRSTSAATVTLTIDGRAGHRAGRHLGDARRDGDGDRDPEALLDRHAGGLRLLPALPGRDRGPQRHAVFLHDAGRRGHGGAAPRPSG